MPWLRQLVAGLSPWKPGFVPRSVHVEFVMHRVTLRQVFLWVLHFTSSCHSSETLSHTTDMNNKLQFSPSTPPPLFSLCFHFVELPQKVFIDWSSDTALYLHIHHWNINLVCSCLFSIAYQLENCIVVVVTSVNSHTNTQELKYSEKSVWTPLDWHRPLEEVMSCNHMSYWGLGQPVWVLSWTE
jgi:hypothetical protein